MLFDANTYILKIVFKQEARLCHRQSARYRFGSPPEFGVCHSTHTNAEMEATDTAVQKATEMNLVTTTGRCNTRYSDCR
jgi:hypothetical protein